MKLRVVKKHFLLFFLLPLLVISACTKIVATDIGGDLLPPGDGVITKDMFLDVVAKNMRDTTTRVSTPDPHMLGYINDRLFGETTAEINVQLKPTAFPFNLPVSEDSLLYDSVVLVLSYTGYWGDTNQNLALRVYDLADDVPSGKLDYDTVYSTNYVVAAGDEITEYKSPKQVDIRRLTDSVKPLNEAAANQLRIRLDASYGQKLLQYDTSGVYKNDSLFSQTIRGFKIKPELTGNAFVRINLLDTNTKLAIYYRYKSRDSVGIIDTTVSYFRCNSYNCGSTNYIVRNRGTGEVNNYLNTADAQDSLIYIDANPGLFADVNIPGLLEDTIPNRIIHRAELLLEQVPDFTSQSQDELFSPPNLMLALYSADSGRRFAFAYDMVFSNGTIINQNVFGCFPIRREDPATKKIYFAYSFDISRYLQGILTRNEKPYKMVLFAPYSDYIYFSETSTFTVFTGNSNGPINFPAVGRIRLGGGNHSKYKMKLHIVYTNI